MSHLTFQVSGGAVPRLLCGGHVIKSVEVASFYRCPQTDNITLKVTRCIGSTIVHELCTSKDFADKVAARIDQLETEDLALQTEQLLAAKAWDTTVAILTGGK